MTDLSQRLVADNFPFVIVLLETIGPTVVPDALHDACLIILVGIKQVRECWTQLEALVLLIADEIDGNIHVLIRLALKFQSIKVDFST
jgi:hypothetical protein